jgi:uncharacterized protein YcfJ
MLKNLIGAAAVAVLALGAAVPANADACSGRNHLGGTVVGGVAGGALGSAVTHGSAGGVIGGAVLGGLAGNAIARSADCHRHSAYYYRHHHRYARYYMDRYGHRHYYTAAYVR